MSIQNRRLEKGWSQEDLTRHSGLSSRTIQRIESGQAVSSESIKCLAAVFDTSIDAIKQEQTMKTSVSKDQSSLSKLNTLENEAVTLGQTLLRSPKLGQTDPLTKIERNAINYGKRLLKNLIK